MHELLNSDTIYVAADIMPVSAVGGKLKLLLSRRVHAPCAGKWALPGCLLGINESAEDALKRLSQEMLGGAKAYFEQLYTFTRPNRDPRGRVISVTYIGIISPSRLDGALKSGTFKAFDVKSEQGELELVNGSEKLNPADLAFDHANIISVGINRLRGKINYSDIGFKFLNDEKRFTMVELEDAFEAVMGEEVDKSNFRRFVKGRYELTGQISRTGEAIPSPKGRPALIYKFNEDAWV